MRLHSESRSVSAVNGENMCWQYKKQSSGGDQSPGGDQEEVLSILKPETKHRSHQNSLGSTMQPQQCKHLTTVIDLKLHKIPQLLVAPEQGPPECSLIGHQKLPLMRAWLSVFGFRGTEGEATELIAGMVLHHAEEDGDLIEMASWGKHLKQPIKAQQCKHLTTFIDLKLHKLPQLLTT